jgi:hypothetical protein
VLSNIIATCWLQQMGQTFEEIEQGKEYLVMRMKERIHSNIFETLCPVAVQQELQQVAYIYIFILLCGICRTRLRFSYEENRHCW